MRYFHKLSGDQVLAAVTVLSVVMNYPSISLRYQEDILMFLIFPLTQRCSKLHAQIFGKLSKVSVLQIYSLQEVKMNVKRTKISLSKLHRFQRSYLQSIHYHLRNSRNPQSWNWRGKRYSMALLLQHKATIQLITTIKMNLDCPLSQNSLYQDLKRKRLRISLMLHAPLRKQVMILVIQDQVWWLEHLVLNPWRW